MINGTRSFMFRGTPKGRRWFYSATNSQTSSGHQNSKIGAMHFKTGNLLNNGWQF
jgi:hypothetical protein